MKKGLLSICMLMGSLFSGYAQQPSGIVKETLSSVLPVSPEAGSLGKFSEIPVSKYTGIPDISIPIHTIKKGDISINLSLSYHSGGNRVDEIASRVGLGWALNAGGSITRSARGLPDVRGGNTDIQRFVTGQMSQNERTTYIYDVNGGRKDSELDIYYLSLNDLSLKVFRENNGAWVTMPRNENVNIQEMVDGYDWIITDGRGIRYKFRDREITESTSTIHSGTSPSNDAGYNSAISTWLLTEIEDTKGNKVNFEYQSSIQNFITMGGQSVTIPQSGSDINCAKTSQYTNVSNTVFGNRIKTIRYADGEVRFLASGVGRVDLPGDSSLSKIDIYNNEGFVKRYQLFTSYFKNNITGVNVPNFFGEMDKYRLRLDSVREESLGNVLRPYRFLYYESAGLPYRNSHAQDHWGFFNGKNNYGTSVSYFEAGLQRGADKSIDPLFAKETILKTVIFPTGGNIDFDYEANVYTTSEIPIDIPFQELVSVAGRNNDHTPGVSYDGLNFHYEKEFQVLPEHLSRGPIDARGYSYVEGVSSGCSCSVSYSVRKPDGTFITFPSQVEYTAFQLNQPGTYKFSADIAMEFQENPYVFFTARVEAKIPPPPGLTNVTGPGLRVKSIKRTFSPGNVMNTYYGYTDPATGFSSGKIAGVPDYKRTLLQKNKKVIPPVGGFLYDCLCQIYSSSSNYSLVNTKGSYIGYTSVTVLDDENGTLGKTTYKYDYVDDINATSVFPFAPNSPQDWKRGQLLEEAQYKKTGNTYDLVKKQTYKYTVIPGSEFQAYGVKIGTATSINYEASEQAIVNGIVSSVYPMASDAYLLTTDTVLVKEGNKVLKVVNNYTYNNGNYQLASSTTQRSDGTVRKRRLFYPTDYSQYAGSATLLSNMLRRFMINIPVQEINTVISSNGEKLASGLIYEYTYVPVSSNGTEQFYLKNIHEADVKLASATDLYSFVNFPSNYINRVSTPIVNAYGQPVFRLVNGKQKIAYVWGYNGQYPIAEIRNADYNLVEAALGGAVAVNNFSKQLNPSPETVASFLAPLYTASDLKNGAVTSYSFKPVIGIRSQTDAKGEVTYYEYDDFQRLKTIKDQNGNIVKSYDYHYKP